MLFSKTSRSGHCASTPGLVRLRALIGIGMGGLHGVCVGLTEAAVAPLGGLGVGVVCNASADSRTLG